MTKTTKTTKTQNIVVGPKATILTLDDLPAPNTKRWVIRRKAEVVHAVRGGLLSYEQALARYNITPAEYADWETHYKNYGLEGLRVTRLQDYRA